VAKAIWHDIVIAESDDTVVVEGNRYFPRTSLREDVLRPSATTTTCFWKGTASYYSLEVDGTRSQDAVWFYSRPRRLARRITRRVAFDDVVRIER
jgi:uncharacterized protein (DUF427 family)